MLQGYTSREIGKALGISKVQAHYDMQVAKSYWKDDYESSQLNEIRAEALSRMDFIYCEAVREYLGGKARGCPVAKYLEIAGNAVQNKVKLSGADIDLKFVQNNVNVTMASEQQVADTFAPMSAADFGAFADAHVQAQLKALEASKAVMDERPKPAAKTDVVDREKLFTEAPTSAEHNVQTGPRFVRHPGGRL